MHLDKIWSGRSDTESEDSKRIYNIVQFADDDGASLNDYQNATALLGFCCDEGVKRNQGRIGAASAPNEIKRILANLPAHQHQVVYDAGNVECLNGEMEQAQHELSNKITDLLQSNAFPIVLGGGHEVAYASFMGLQQYLDAVGDQRAILIINFDAHFDLRTNREPNSGTSFNQIAEFCASRNQPFTYHCYGVSQLSNTANLFTRAKQLNVNYILDTDMQERFLEKNISLLEQTLEKYDHVYLTVDLDVLPAYICPAVSAPAAYGVSLVVLEEMIKVIRDSKKLRVADIAEYNPRFDQDSITGKVAARIAYTLFSKTTATTTATTMF
ncbi:formimidoylglutamase [Heterostelium album PN500]|uniref:Formimidoylglutamase n=1 Tax=Heterostelium pallidum (strain ATCC 26659 / Pp 5 / PN500) TaxID=670386 RepID=D3BL89_HETP5|nr:formimidoylglutamase [Heterostelium album PN500]EFA77823.1 formimidoylglutamase [Heterostelium album PN500]|eukprot:XP_020429951.1 formimidoylglutamase [Heterostelium album PN500]